MRRLLPVLCVLILVSAAVGQVTLPEWADPVSVAGADGPAHTSGWDLHNVVVDDAGAAHLVWEDSRYSETHEIAICYRRLDGETLSAVETIPCCGLSSGSCHITLTPEGLPAVVWRSGALEEKRIFLSIRTADYWTPAEPITPPNYRATAGVLEIDSSGRKHLFWMGQEHGNDKERLYYQIGVETGWGDPIPLSSADLPVMTFSVAKSRNGTLHLVYIEALLGWDYYGYLYYRSFKGIAWTDPLQLNGGYEQAYHASIDITGANDPTVVYSIVDLISFDSTIRVAHRSGNQWVGISTGVEDIAATLYPTVCTATNGQFFILWNEVAPGLSSLHLLALNGVDAGIPQTLDTETSRAWNPTLVCDPKRDTLYAMWFESDPSLPFDSVFINRGEVEIEPGHTPIDGPAHPIQDPRFKPIIQEIIGESKTVFSGTGCFINMAVKVTDYPGGPGIKRVLLLTEGHPTGLEFTQPADHQANDWYFLSFFTPPFSMNPGNCNLRIRAVNRNEVASEEAPWLIHVGRNQFTSTGPDDPDQPPRITSNKIHQVFNSNLMTGRRSVYTEVRIETTPGSSPVSHVLACQFGQKTIIAPLLDDGLHYDLEAGDGVYGLVIDGSGYQPYMNRPIAVVAFDENGLESNLWRFAVGAVSSHLDYPIWNIPDYLRSPVFVESRPSFAKTIDFAR